jgi:hypothetical protein
MNCACRQAQFNAATIAPARPRCWPCGWRDAGPDWSGPAHPLEKGEHARLAVEAGKTLRDYAAAIHENHEAVHKWHHAAEVANAAGNISSFSDLTKYVSALSVIHGEKNGPRDELTRGPSLAVFARKGRSSLAPPDDIAVTAFLQSRDALKLPS